MKIGIFDSGLGGLSVLKCARKMIPGADYIYYADEEHVPYGEKNPDEVRGYITDIFHFMIEKKVDGIIIACNTATSLVSKEYRKGFNVPIVGMEPALKKAVDLYKDENKNILVAATPITINGRKLHDLVESVDKKEEAVLVATPGLVRFAENGEFESEKVEEYLRRTFKESGVTNVGTVVLGCTHFNYFSRLFKKVLGEDIHLVDGCEGTIRQLMRVMGIGKTEVDKTGDVEYYFSGKPVEDTMRIDMCMKQLEKYEVD